MTPPPPRRMYRLLGAIAVALVVIVAGTSPAPAGPVAPQITGFTHTPVLVRQTVGILGQGLSGATQVSFRDASTTELTVVDDTKIEVVVPIPALTGKVRVHLPSGTIVSPTKLKIAPHITSVQPFSAPLGSTITLGGYTFTGARHVRITGEEAQFVVESYTKITAIVPANARTGFAKVKVTTPGGTNASPRFRITS